MSDMIRASGAPVRVSIADVARAFTRPSRRQIADWMTRIKCDEKDRPFLSVYDVHRWAGTPDGAVVVLRDSAQGDDSNVESWGWSLVQQATVATLIVGESITSGEEPEPRGDEQRSDPISPSM